MRLHRFYVSQPLGEEVVIESVSTIKQWFLVFRYKESDLVILFNGDGNDITYKIKSIDKSVCKLSKIESKKSISISKKLTAYISVIKKDNFELIVQKITELGVSNIVPIISERSEKKNLNMERLEKVAIEASEQCGRGDIPKISEIKSLDESLGSQKGDLLIFANMDGIKITDKTLFGQISSAQEINLWIGPEGGWSDLEIEKFKNAKMQSISLGNTVLRAETAAILGVGLLLSH